MKKLLAILAVSVLLISATTVSAMARHHGGYGSRSVGRTAYAVCPYEDCDYTYVHRHDGAYYRCHYAGDGHDYCAVDYGYKSSGNAYGGCCRR